ncbi:aminoacyl-tRNA hydrolase [Psychrosphaera sp. B3R10]|uniref:aminoacyl-tRNA hydrolase n=1 Tax=unclassified Psychrosphaera TaxID=2641570 RepID=UPI001C0A2394|nr:aminoacyl-tRNA hydrolase [Psychrosphaera sp. 1_MG-2023]MBU2882785.1 aminoacyl-tRNA hydrolase [Psychrosphaera sp. I2R16]MBU2988065.1 aminoacyl-tRNA hydrolase [Psychrosphaera sp. B3R10]MDO6721085.1 aminoacyl-tRNA hydrolase [Psychrosphaera sp. 1_MG-2023]
MSSTIQLIVGLANPGPEYQHTRHNAGAWFIEELCRANNVSLKNDPKYFGYTAKINFAGQDIRLLVPTTFMNLSGKSVAALANFFKIKPEEILVAHDELDMQPGVAKFKKGGGHGGHNGLKDIIAKLANNREFYRLRIGIGHPGSREKVTGWVLGKAPRNDQELMDAAIDEAVRCTEIWLKQDLKKAQNRLHSFSAS